MQITAAQTQSWIDSHDTSLLPGQNLAWLRQLRSQAISQFEQIGLPSVRDEAWRYTKLTSLKSKVFELGAQAVPDTAAPVPHYPNLNPTESSRLVLVNGRVSQKLSNVSLSADATFTGLADYLTDAPQHLETVFNSTLPSEQHGFTALNTAYCADGFVLHLPRGCVVQDTLEVIFIHSSDQPNSDTPISHTRNLIIAEPNSQCRVIERHLGNNGEVYLNNCVTEIIADENAHIDHYKIHQESDQAFHIGGVFIQQKANSQVTSHNISLSGLLVRNDINSALTGQGAHIEMNGLVLGKQRQHIDNHTEVNHAVANCSSDEYYKTVLDDNARSVFRGRIIVAQDAQQTNADQQNNNLLLNKDAHADCKPQLEIYADDVKCSHGATVGQLDAKSLFYLNSRGIDKASAKSLLTFAFANQVIERIAIPALRQELTETLAGQLLS
jgi:Fe-S cluster assembly protein SufD